MSETNKNLSRRFTAEVWNSGKIDLIDDLVSTDYVNHSAPPGLPSDRQGLKQFVNMYRTAFPDIHIEIKDIIAEGDRVMTRWTGTGTHKGELMGIAPTNKPVTVTGMDESRYSGGKVVEAWNEFDLAGMMQQLGVTSLPE